MTPASAWLIGADGLHHSDDAEQWLTGGLRAHPILAVLRQPQRLLCGTLWGLWEVPEGASRWIQLHDETLTEVLAIAPAPGDPGVVAATPYGLTLGQRDAHGPARWMSRSDALRVDERFSNAVLPRPDAPGQWLVGTEAGVLCYTEPEDRWQRTDLSGRPCRALLHAFDAIWAGTDDGGVWRSVDGLAWQRAGRGLDDGTVFALAATGEQIIAGTMQGLCIGDGASAWRRCGPRLLVSAVAAHPDPDGPWLAGGTPGGLWRSDDAGASWRQSGRFDTVHCILPPEAAA